jgi:sec-independent protein translocase protein TatB
MMPGLGFAETILLVIVAIVVIGPKDLPLMMRKFGRFTGRMRSLAFEFRQGFDELGRQAELDELRREVADLKERSGLSDLERELVNDAAGIERDVSEAMTPTNPPSRPPTIGPMSAATVGATAGAIAGASATDPTASSIAPVEPTPEPVTLPPTYESGPTIELPEDGSRIDAPREDVVAR